MASAISRIWHGSRLDLSMVSDSTTRSTVPDLFLGKERKRNVTVYKETAEQLIKYNIYRQIKTCWDMAKGTVGVAIVGISEKYVNFH
jgi:hypothetical protein